VKVLVTGATGFVGSHLTEALLRQGAQVRTLVRSRDHLRWIDGLQGVEFCTGELEDRPSLERAVAGVEVIYHVAGVIKARHAAEYEKVNAGGTSNLLDAAMNANLKRFVYVSSQAAVGPSTIDAPLDEEMPPRPITPYGASKLEGERRVRGSGLPFTIVRPPAVYGPRDADLFHFFKLAGRGVVPIPGFGVRKVSLIYVEDLVQGLLLAAGHERALGRTYFLKSGDHAWSQLAQGLRKVMGRGRAVRIPVPVLWTVAIVGEAVSGIVGKAAALNRHKARELTQRAWLCSTQRAEKELDFAPRWPLERGLERTAKWYREAGWIKG
jgi:nucleoside-diphosphate-sugar epimerase